MHPNAKEKVQGSLLGVQLGDALGAPVETMKPGEIREVLGGGMVETFHYPIQKKIRDTGNMSPGDTTDDWQLTRAVAVGILRARGWGMGAVLYEHLKAFHDSQTGWGKATRKALTDIHEGKRHGLDPVPRSLTEGGGNGVMMKVIPLAMLSAYREQGESDMLRLRVKQLSLLTHGDPHAYLGALVVARIALAIFSTPDRPLQDVMKELIPHIAQEEVSMGYTQKPLTHALQKAISNEVLYRSMDELVTVFNPGFKALETAPFVVAICMRNEHENDFRKAVLEAVNAGGDADTNASIVGGLIGARVGLQGIPVGWRDFRKEFQESIQLGEELASFFWS
jgi:ADP-ribosylglycohydrolase